MSNFGSAFKAARKAGKKTFSFGGKSYTTKVEATVKTPKSVAVPPSRPVAAKAAPAKPRKVVGSGGPVGTGKPVVGTGKPVVGTGKRVSGSGGIVGKGKPVVGSGLTISARAKKANAGGGQFAKMLGGVKPKTSKKK